MEKLRKRCFLFLEGELAVEHWVVVVSSEASDICLFLILLLILSLLIKEYLSITIVGNIIYLIAYANILTVRTYVLKTRTYDKMQTEIFKVGPNYL